MTAHVAPAPPGPRIGCDLQAVAPVAEALVRGGQRYLRAVLAPQERTELTRGGDGPAAESVAARFAAKEAVLKTLAPARTDAVPWPHIAVRTAPHGVPRVELSGPAAALARRRGLTQWSVSMSHDGGYALAVALALGPGHGSAARRQLQSMTPTLVHRPKETSMDRTATENAVREVLAEHGRLSGDAHTLTAEADLYRAGMTSHASVNVMLALEDEFDVEFPEERLTKATFTSIGSISDALEEISND